MKTILLIGMGKFGRQLCKSLSQYDNELMIVDSDENRLSDLLGMVTSAKIGDCTKEETLRSFGINDFDECIVCIYDNFQSSLEVTDMLRTVGARHIIAAAGTDVHSKLLLRCGADEVVFPEKDIAESAALRISNDNIFNYIKLSDSFSVCEIKPLSKWLGKSVAECQIRNKYDISIIAVKRGENDYFLPSAEYVFTAGEHLMVVGSLKAVEDVTK